MIRIDPGSLSGKAHCPQQYICEKKVELLAMNKIKHLGVNAGSYCKWNLMKNKVNFVKNGQTNHML